MMCISPITLKDANNMPIHVPCGNCYECNTNKRDAWTWRIMQELKVAESASFVTLTYNDENLKVINKEDAQLFIKRLREENRKDVKYFSVKYYLTAEYGTESKRPHYHAVIFNLSTRVLNLLVNGKIWNKGHVDIIPVGIGNVHYLNTFHVIGKYEGNPEVLPFNLMSKGLGKSYIKLNRQYHKDNMDATYQFNGYKKKLPRYMMDKIFTPGEMDILNGNMQKLSIENQKKFEKECKKVNVNPFKQKNDIREYKRRLFISKCKKAQKL